MGGRFSHHFTCFATAHLLSPLWQNHFAGYRCIITVMFQCQSYSIVIIFYSRCHVPSSLSYWIFSIMFRCHCRASLFIVTVIFHCFTVTVMFHCHQARGFRALCRRTCWERLLLMVGRLGRWATRSWHRLVEQQPSPGGEGVLERDHTTLSQVR